VLAAFTAATASRDAGPVNALAVLNKADTIAAGTVAGAGEDVWEAAGILARGQAELLRPRVADVLPVIGLLAETAETGAFTAGDAEALRALVAIDPALFAAMMLAGDLFVEMDAPVDRPTRIRLLQLLDLYGIAAAVELLRADPALSAGALRRRLLDASGFAELRRRLGELFRSRADGIKASAALASMAALAAASGDWAERQRIHDAIEVLLQRPEAHQLRLLEALTLLSSGAVSMPAELTRGDPAARRIGATGGSTGNAGRRSPGPAGGRPGASGLVAVVRVLRCDSGTEQGGSCRAPRLFPVVAGAQGAGVGRPGRGGAGSR